MVTLTLKREKFPYGTLCDVKVLIDGRDAVTLSYGEQKDITLSEGEHTVVAKMRWIKSEPLALSLTVNDHKRITVECLPLIEASFKAYIPPFTVFTLKELPEKHSFSH